MSTKEQRFENRVRCLACKYYGMNVCPLMMKTDVFEIDNCILDLSEVKDLKEGSPEWFMFNNNPVMFLRYINFINKENLPEIGTKVFTLRAGFGGIGGDIRYVTGIRDGYIRLSHNKDSEEYGVGLSEINSWYNDFFKM